MYVNVLNDGKKRQWWKVGGTWWNISARISAQTQAVSFQQLRDFDAKVHHECRVTYPVILVREVVDQIVQPALVSVCLSRDIKITMIY